MKDQIIERSLSRSEALVMRVGTNRPLHSDIRWITIPNPLVRLTHDELRNVKEIGARGLLVCNLPLTVIESYALGLNPGSFHNPQTVDMAFLGAPDLASSLSWVQQSELRKVTDKLSVISPSEFETKARKRMLSIFERVFGRVWNKSINQFQGGEMQIGALQDVMNRANGKNVLIIDAHGGGKKTKKVAAKTSSGLVGVDGIEHVVKSFGERYAAVIDASCNYGGVTVDFDPPHIPYFGIHGPISLKEGRKTVVAKEGNVDMYPARLRHEDKYYFDIWLAKRVTDFENTLKKYISNQ